MTDSEKQAFHKYENSSKHQQSVVEILSVLEVGVTRRDLMQCANAAGIRLHRGRKITHASWGPFVRRLVKMGVIREFDNELEAAPEIKELVARAASREGRFKRWVKAANSTIYRRRYRSYGYYSFNGEPTVLEDLRIAVHLNNSEEFTETYDIWASRFPNRSPRAFFERVFMNPFDGEWLKSLAAPIRDVALSHLAESANTKLLPATEVFDLLREVEGEVKDWPRGQIATHDLLVGDFEQALQWKPTDRVAASLLQGWERCAHGQWEAATDCFKAAFKQVRVETRRRDILFDDVSGAFYVLSLLAIGDADRIRLARKYTELALRKQPESHSLFFALKCVADLLEGRLKQASEIFSTLDYITLEPHMYQMFILAAKCWVNVKRARKHFAEISLRQVETDLNGYFWVSAEFASILAKLRPKEASMYAPLKSHEELGSVSILDAIPDEQPWERGLRALERLSEVVEKGRKGIVATASRLTWRVEGSGSPTALKAYEQRIGKTGRWTKGRVVTLKRLRERTNLSCMTHQDVSVCEAIGVSRGKHGHDVLSMALETALGSLVEHPLVFRADKPSTPVEVVRAEPQLRVNTHGRKVHIKLAPTPPEKADFIAVFETPRRLVVTAFDAKHREIFSLLGKKGLEVPAGSKDKIIRAVSAVSSLVTVHSDIGGGDADAKEVEADPRTHFYLTPFQEGLQAQPLVQPFLGEGPTYAPGKGGEVVFAIVGGHRSRTTRDRSEEVRRYNRAVAACPSLHHASWDSTTWTLSDPTTCLELLDELHSMGDQVVVRWPQGEAMKIQARASTNSLSVKIRKKRDWFKIDGDVKLDSGLVMGLRELLDQIDGADGRFLKVGDKEFVALTERFRRRVEELAAFVDRHGKGLRFHPSRTHALEALVEDAGQVDADRNWSQRLRQFREAQALEPKLPSTLQADLRGYQTEGFRWAARLAAWGAGACLADDMGLGKTLQALTVALERAPSGPTLVIAPTSVCPNWLDETRRFTPTLNAFQFGPGNRSQMIEKLTPYDLMVCSYGLLHQEIEKLESVEWETIVLDEAQAIKNRNTLRSRAAMRLNGGFRMITTGTPIENHLGELWNLFHFINPGLLGSADSFSNKFGSPIHQAGSADARNRLKRLIQPFILRRTKSAVLDELPSRTEITIRVEMSSAERALYEALRQRAVERVEMSEEDDGPGHLRILAEIMKLRRACCHPQLVMPDTEIPGSKLESFGYTVDDLLASGHKALVFSQFVGHLKIVRSYLDRKGIEYRYLDGSTPMRKRKEEVDAFQAGNGDLFLISLRAGGQGLNLTAADYVLHLDPWWNPAVEDQASDRAHRIGQTRPVTIYRFVMKKTIEEQIVDLHASKRDLADHLLEGADMSGKMSADELLALIRDS